jgi:hypothetical protein
VIGNRTGIEGGLGVGLPIVCQTPMRVGRLSRLLMPGDVCQT